jgi:hypothetical protein
VNEWSDLVGGRLSEFNCCVHFAYEVKGGFRRQVRAVCIIALNRVCPHFPKRDLGLAFATRGQDVDPVMPFASFATKRLYWSV